MIVIVAASLEMVASGINILLIICSPTNYNAMLLLKLRQLVVQSKVDRDSINYRFIRIAW